MVQCSGHVGNDDIRCARRRQVGREGRRGALVHRADHQAAIVQPDLRGELSGSRRSGPALHPERLRDLRLPGSHVQAQCADSPCLGRDSPEESSQPAAPGEPGARRSWQPCVSSRTFRCPWHRRRAIDAARWRPASRVLRYYDAIDIALDTFTYGGGTSTIEAIWQGVPVLTSDGDRWTARLAVSVLSNAGLQRFVQPDVQAYIDAAVDWALSAATPDTLRALRRTMRGRLTKAPVCDCPRFAREMEAVYRRVWQESRGGRLSPRRWETDRRPELLPLMRQADDLNPLFVLLQARGFAPEVDRPCLHARAFRRLSARLLTCALVRVCDRAVRRDCFFMMSLPFLLRPVRPVVEQERSSRPTSIPAARGCRHVAFERRTGASGPRSEAATAPGLISRPCASDCGRQPAAHASLRLTPRWILRVIHV